ncbi:hypothetical protein C483_12253 [Natrialba hulunbeirensis JCM 10989]|uniref:Lipoprotein n=1 Tax=Natrialba hulunbeirensis JCM 10989 TaxID=1227493 RepID=L9ZW28_9EURY|nr:Hvo_1808 family surface protein [Natrialba hulunbeirensis]ELY90281.1 hypothetical protein C483_12253 [Natrialba hulunbeirensis JCM 10989]
MTKRRGSDSRQVVGGRLRTRVRSLPLGLVAIVLLVLLAGCTLPASPDQFGTDREYGDLGEYSPEDTFAFDEEATAELSEAELEQAKYRAMARIEVVRELRFEHDVELEVITREEYREQRGESGTASPFVNEFWRGTFVVDGETDANQELDALYGASVQGYYTDDRIVIVTDPANDGVRIDRDTLVHELVHALQDQHFGLAREGETLDERRAELGLIEGEANYVPELYDERCGEQWHCLAASVPTDASTPEADDGTGGEADVDGDGDGDANSDTDADTDTNEINSGLFLSIYAPYAMGPEFVATLHDRGGWDAVDAAYDDRPTSTAQLIDPERYPDDPVTVDVPDRSDAAWEPITVGGESDEPRTDTVGEATLFATLWANGVIDRPLTAGAPEHSPYNYSAPETSGWAGDTFQVYQQVSTDGDEGTNANTDADGGEGGSDDDHEHHDSQHAFVWQLTWDTPNDAATFADAYRTLLATHGATLEDSNSPVPGAQQTIHHLPDNDPFAGGYAVSVSDDTVTIVGAPSTAALESVHDTVPTPTPDSTAATASPPARAGGAGPYSSPVPSAP